MVFGVGIDIIEVERVEHRVASGNGFREMVFSPAEIEYCEKIKNKYENYAVRFSAKEAFLKAMGTGWTSESNYHEIEVINNESGKPHIHLSGTTLKTFTRMKLGKISLSMNHIHYSPGDQDHSQLKQS